jgi:hypothetical protein
MPAGQPATPNSKQESLPQDSEIPIGIEQPYERKHQHVATVNKTTVPGILPAPLRPGSPGTYLAPGPRQRPPEQAAAARLHDPADGARRAVSSRSGGPTTGPEAELICDILRHEYLAAKARS